MEDLRGKAPAPGGPETQLTSAEWNLFFEEIINLVANLGTANPADTSQLEKAVHVLVGRTTAYQSAGTSSAYTLTNFAGEVATSAIAGHFLARFRPHTNSVAGTASLPTITINGFGPNHVVREDGTFLQASDLSTTRDALVRFDPGTGKWFLLNASLGAPPATLPAGYINGLTMQRNTGEHGSTPTEFRDVQILAGRCRDVANQMDMVLAVSLAKRFDANVAAGGAGGGWPNVTLGARQVSTWYRVFLIGDSNSGDVDAGFDSVANSAAQALLADYNAAESASMDSYRQIGWVRTTAGSNVELEPFMNALNDPNTFYWTGGQGVADWNPGAAYGGGTAAQEVVTLDFVPPDAVALVDFCGLTRANSGAAQGGCIIQPIGHPDIAPTRALNTKYIEDAPVAGAGGDPNNGEFANVGEVRVRVDGNREHHIRIVATSNFFPFLNTKGFVYER